MRVANGSAAAPAASCRKCLRWGSFMTLSLNGLFALNACRLHYRPPFLDLGFLERRERLWRLLLAWRNVEALLYAARPHRRIFESFNNGSVELGDDGVGCTLGGP